jgi:hypothetical protein
LSFFAPRWHTRVWENSDLWIF